MIHKDQQNVAVLCEAADFIDSGYQSFIEQVHGLPPRALTEAAFYAGAGLALKLREHFVRVGENYPPGAADYLSGLVAEEVNRYLLDHGMALEWEPHVPSRWKQ